MRPRSITVGSRVFPVELPNVRDPRLHLAGVIVSLQILGQTVFDFRLSIAQILVSVLTCAFLELGITFWRRGVIAWPASAMLTGNGVAFILRVPGTEPGDWWSLRGGWIFAGTAAVSLLSKYLIRVGGRHVFNPSNIGLVLCFLALGPARVEPLDFWWAPMEPALLFALTIIVVGGLVITWRVGMLGVAASFWWVFALCVGIVAAAGHCMTARWHLGPVCGDLFWWILVTSPEILVFLFFMITDPKTAPRGRVARIVYGASVAGTCALLVAPQRTEYAAKVAVLSGLAIVCAVRPFVERFFPAAGSPDDDLRVWSTRLVTRGRATLGRAALGLGAVGVGVVLLVTAGIPARSTAEAASVSLRDRVVDVDPLEVPRPRLDPSLDTVDASIDEADAEQIARDVVADLTIKGDALELRDRDIAAAGTAGPVLRGIEEIIDRADRTDRLVVPRYLLDDLTVLVVRSDSQARPQVGVALRGRIRRTTYSGLSPPNVTRVTTAPFRHTYSLLKIEDHYLIYDHARPQG